MRAGELAGGDLGLCTKRNESSKYQRYAACNHPAAPHLAKQISGCNVDRENDKQGEHNREMMTPAGIITLAAMR